MIAGQKPVEVFVLRYMPNAVRGEFINIGLIMIEPGANGNGFAEVRFTQDWRRVFCLDAQVDIEYLQAMERDLQRQLSGAGDRDVLMKRVQESFSGVVELSPMIVCLTDDPPKELRTLMSLYLETPGKSVVKQTLTGRRLILQTMRNAFDAASVNELLMKEIPVSAYTKPGDPFKFDFGYRIRGDLKLFQAVSLKNDIISAVTLAARFPGIGNAMRTQVSFSPILTAVVDDDLDRSNEATAFALGMMQDAEIKVEPMRNMPRLAEVARQELRA